MKSPVAEGVQLEREVLEPGLVVHRCPQSGGVFIPADSYWHWLRKNPNRLPQLPIDTAEPKPVKLTTSSDTDKMAKLCPVGGAVMVRCRVGHGFGFHLDRSETGGIWLDSGEWELLKSRNFHDELHLMFAAPWQRKVREEEKKSGIETRLRERLGEEVYATLSELKSHLAGHPARSEALAFLSRGE
jgi:Zn-finger nucleic acid-binding protein